MMFMIKQTDFYCCNIATSRSLKHELHWDYQNAIAITGVWNICNTFMFLLWCSVVESWSQVRTVKNDNHFGLGGAPVLNVSVHVLPETTESDSNQLCFTSFEMLLSLIVVVPLMLSIYLWWTYFQVHADNIWIAGIKTHHHSRMKIQIFTIHLHKIDPFHS